MELGSFQNRILKMEPDWFQFSVLTNWNQEPPGAKPGKPTQH
jgi:hypothetical protein